MGGILAYTTIMGGKLCIRERSINRPFFDVKHCCDSDIVMEHCYGDRDSEEG
jgi:hypothetical protein